MEAITEDSVNIVIDEWIRQIKRQIKAKVVHGVDLPPSFRKLCHRFTDARIRELIYDYLDRNMRRGVDGCFEIIIHTKDHSEATVLKVLHADEERLLCVETEQVRNNVAYVAQLLGVRDERTGRVVGVELQPLLGFGQW